MTTAFPIPHPNLDIVPQRDRAETVRFDRLRRALARMKAVAAPKWNDHHPRQRPVGRTQTDPYLTASIMRQF